METDPAPARRPTKLWLALTALLAAAALLVAIEMSRRVSLLTARVSVLEHPAPPSPAAAPAQAPQSAPAADKIVSDEDLKQLADLADATRARFNTGLCTEADVVRAQSLYDEARFMHGDITAAEWMKLSDAADARARMLLRSQYVQGRADLTGLLDVYARQFANRRLAMESGGRK